MSTTIVQILVRLPHLFGHSPGAAVVRSPLNSHSVRLCPLCQPHSAYISAQTYIYWHEYHPWPGSLTAVQGVQGNEVSRAACCPLASMQTSC